MAREELDTSQVQQEQKTQAKPKCLVNASIYDGLRVFEEVLRLESKTEALKQQLALRPDFNLFDAFKVLDIDNQGVISADSLKRALQDIGIYSRDQELELFLKRYSSGSGDGLSLRFSESVDAFLSANTYYATLVNRRGSNYYPVYARKLYRDDMFSFATRQLFHELLRTSLFVE